MLKNKKIVLGICGGIAAYKCAHLVRLLIKEGATVKVVMTPSAKDFVTPLTLSVLSRNDVWTAMFDANHKWNNHVELAEWADLILIAPLTANTLSKMVSGACDNILLAVLLSARTKIMLAPAMDLEMYAHSTVKANLETLKSRGVDIIPAEKGELASGLSGEGRMAEPETILGRVVNLVGSHWWIRGKKVLINAGPTYEPLDPVRFIGNRSSGKMGVALAEEFYNAGADVTLVLGPVSIRPHAGIRVIHVETAKEMYEHTLFNFVNCDLAICAAAVADYRPVTVSATKIKKKASTLDVELERTVDILAELGRKKQKGQVLVGFALETNDLKKYATEKLKAKKVDVIVANLAGDGNTGIGADNNEVTLFDKNNKITKFELKSKGEVAKDIVSYLGTYFK